MRSEIVPGITADPERAFGVWADSDRNAAEAELDRRADAEIDAGGGFRGPIDELIAAVDG